MNTVQNSNTVVLTLESKVPKLSLRIADLSLFSCLMFYEEEKINRTKNFKIKIIFYSSFILYKKYAIQILNTPPPQHLH